MKRRRRLALIDQMSVSLNQTPAILEVVLHGRVSATKPVKTKGLSPKKAGLVGSAIGPPLQRSVVDENENKRIQEQTTPAGKSKPVVRDSPIQTVLHSQDPAVITRDGRQQHPHQHQVK
ncbi:uncharacterized protein LOC126988871 [Eriocheir sinensis]|uniref:uncharacterized protein LOC126988871 n=1 Tax=Eriocheir sinensis TaxID=95602 RepID=UPI0021C9D167|nr:uncharacterized protein LOC126988871 [Eriocheir sinensis]